MSIEIGTDLVEMKLNPVALFARANAKKVAAAIEEGLVPYVRIEF